MIVTPRDVRHGPSRRICNPKPLADDADYKSANTITPDYKSGVTKKTNRQRFK